MKFGTEIAQMAKKRAVATGEQKAWFIRHNETITVRFLHEPPTWMAFKQAWDQGQRTSWPVPEGAPFDPDLQVSMKAYANILMLDDGQGNCPDKVFALLLPKTLKDQLTAHYEHEGTITNCDVDIWKVGEGLETTYMCKLLPPADRDVSKYKPHDLEQLLQEQYDRVWGEVESEPVTDSSPVVRQRIVIDEPTDDLDVSDPEIKRRPELKLDMDRPPLEELLGLGIGPLREIATRFGIETKGRKRAEIIAELAVDPDEESAG